MYVAKISVYRLSNFQSTNLAYRTDFLRTWLNLNVKTGI